MVEIEVKIRISDLKKIKERIEAQGARCVGSRHQEENTLYDFTDRSLYTKQHAIRLRSVDKKTFLTFKGAKQKSRKFKIREEFETEVKNKKQLEKILQSIGLKPVFRYQKHRTVYRKKNLKISLDETSVGNFLELEGSQSDIVRFAKELDISKQEFIKTDYIQLMKESEIKK